ncbi:MAG: endonuclease MutS2, partial [Bacteroidales bacterium]|nr:endonuclease MutS2 [Bacteroidales bacterium]
MNAAKIESKLGFDRIRSAIASKCATDYALERVEKEAVSTDPAVIRKRLALTDEMRLILMFEDNFPTVGYIDAVDFLEALKKPGVSIDVLSLAKLKTLTDTLKRLTSFFSSVKDGIYPNLKKMASSVVYFPEVQRRIETIMDRHSKIKDSASDNLAAIRRSIREKEQGLSRRAEAILRRAQEEGLCDDDAAVTLREGRLLIPVSTAMKRKIPGFVFGESASGKTSFIQPAEVMELENEINELHYREEKEIAAILREFTEFLRPYLPELLQAAVYVGETDFLMSKAQIALDYICGMPIISSDGSLNLRKARHPLLE